jgi:hypothetical protein
MSALQRQSEYCSSHAMTKAQNNRTQAKIMSQSYLMVTVKASKTVVRRCIMMQGWKGRSKTEFATMFVES